MLGIKLIIPISNFQNKYELFFYFVGFRDRRRLKHKKNSKRHFLFRVFYDIMKLTVQLVLNMQQKL